MIGLYILVVGSIYFLLAVFLTFWLASRPKKTIHQIIVFTFVATVFVLIPTWDIIPGRLYFKHLCKTEGGIKIYKQTELPAEYWDESGNIQKEILSKVINTESQVQDESQNLFHTRKTKKLIIDKNSGELLGTYTYFIYFGGWLINNTGLHVTGISCPPLEQASFSDLIRKVFVQTLE